MQSNNEQRTTNEVLISRRQGDEHGEVGASLVSVPVSAMELGYNDLSYKEVDLLETNDIENTYICWLSELRECSASSRTSRFYLP
jgi:hypothetical protein